MEKKRGGRTSAFGGNGSGVFNASSGGTGSDFPVPMTPVPVLVLAFPVPGVVLRDHVLLLVL